MGRESGNPGINKLANVFGAMMDAKTDRPPVIDFGIINGDYSLTTNSFRRPIPKGDWSVCRSLLYDPSVPLTETYLDGEHDHPDASMGGAHVNQVKLPHKMYWVRPGQKVLVAWVANEAIVIDVIYDSTTLGEGEPDWE